ncbi:MAG: class I SAM-dependent methyltransferase [Thermoleophilaceae bacterium]|nr:class I SAM-dependent methyltransferase [Thermoleophilaceae bacterium]
MAVATEISPVIERLDPRRGRDRRFAIRFWDGSEIGPTDGLPADFTLRLTSPQALGHLLWAPGQLGLARAWVAGAVELDGDLDHALRTLRERARGARLDARALARLAALAARHGAWRRPPVPASEARVRGRRHSLRRDSQAVRHHYDVPTAFYRLVLGPSMVYSCACFDDPDEPLETAQERKLDLICRKLELREGERFLDVGCGWGSLVIHAAREYGARAVGVTLSPEQAREAERRIEEAGLRDRCEVRVLDYRELSDGPYDKIASVGMYEHVGASGLDRYFKQLTALLRPGGALLNHGITRNAPRPKRTGAFIHRYVFPDGHLHPIGDVVAAVGRSGLELRHLETLREHYAITLRRWVANLEANRDEAARLAGADRERIWRLYMTGSAQAFEEGELGVYQTLAVAPEAGGRQVRALARTPSQARFARADGNAAYRRSRNSPISSATRSGSSSTR